MSKSWGVLSKMRQAVIHMSTACPAVSLVLSWVRLHIFYTSRSHKSESADPLYPRHPLALPSTVCFLFHRSWSVCWVLSITQGVINICTRRRCKRCLWAHFVPDDRCVCAVCLRGLGGSFVRMQTSLWLNLLLRHFTLPLSVGSIWSCVHTQCWYVMCFYVYRAQRWPPTQKYFSHSFSP